MRLKYVSPSSPTLEDGVSGEVVHMRMGVDLETISDLNESR